VEENMEKTKQVQKKNGLTSYIYAGIVAMLVIACAVTIAFVNAKSTTDANVGEESVLVNATTFIVPMKNATISKDYSSAELQYNTTLKQWEIHKAIDFVAGDDLNVYAVAKGTISNIYTNYLEGTVIEILHDDGITSVYKSLNKEVNVAIGQKVNAGEVIATVSESMAQELNVGKHLHFEMFKDGKKVNPNNYLDLGVK
jgi:murein DD-endopeptidase MepM/ murein hydrolase activator NlpD